MLWGRLKPAEVATAKGCGLVVATTPMSGDAVGHRVLAAAEMCGTILVVVAAELGPNRVVLSHSGGELALNAAKPQLRAALGPGKE